MDTIEVLQRTDQILTTHGWTRGGKGWSGGSGGDGPLCLEGAFFKAIGIHVGRHNTNLREEDVARMRSHPAYRVLVRLAFGADGCPCGCDGALAAWNDSHSEWAVHDLIKRAIKAERNKKPQFVITPDEYKKTESKPVFKLELVPEQVPESWVEQYNDQRPELTMVS